MLEKTDCGVKCRGELVIAWFGNVEINLNHEQAIRIANTLREAGRDIKRATGDPSRRWHVAATLKAKTETVQQGDKVRSWRVDLFGSKVSFTFNEITIDLGAEEAITLGNWLRIRGKEAAQNTQDFRHWTEIISA